MNWDEFRENYSIRVRPFYHVNKDEGRAVYDGYWGEFVSFYRDGRKVGSGIVQCGFCIDEDGEVSFHDNLPDFTAAISAELELYKFCKTLDAVRFLRGHFSVLTAKRLGNKYPGEEWAAARYRNEVIGF